MTISAVIITYNEEDHIGACLDSIGDVVDEIVVVDSFSEDATQSICEERNVRFVEHQFDGHVEQKNFAMNLADSEYILSLDADERLSDTLSESIRSAKRSRHSADGYTMNRLNNYCGQWIKHGGWYPDKKLRLWRKTEGKWGGTNPHDQVIMNRNSEVRHLEGDLLHYTVDSIEEHIDQIQSFSGIAARELYRAGEKPALMKVIGSPIFKFIRDYLIRGGFLDGYYGFVIATNSAWAKYLKYLKAYELFRNEGSSN